MLWFAAPPIDRAKPTVPKYSLAYLHHLAVKKRKRDEALSHAAADGMDVDNVGNDGDSSESMLNGAGDQNSKRRPGVAFENSRVGGMTATERLAEVMRDYPRV